MNWKKIFHKSDNAAFVIELFKSIETIRSNSPFLVLVPSTTEYSWMGVNRATVALFPGQTIVLPQYYSQSVFTEKEQKEILNKIIDLNFEQIIFSGFPLYFGIWMEELKKKGIQTALIYHGFFSELSGNDQQKKQLKEIITLNKNQVLDKIAFNKKGMGESLKEMWGINSFKILLRTAELESIPKNESGFHVGVLGNDQFRKNLHNQVAAASMVKDAQIHVTTDTSFEYIPASKIIRHKTGQRHVDFTRILGSMNLNLHLSYSESWGQLTTESLAMGVPCLVSYHSDIFDYNEELRQKLVVEDFDNSYAIFKRIKTVMEDVELPEKCKAYVTFLNQESEKTITKFLEA